MIRPYNRKEKIGNLSRKAQLYTPTYGRNTIGGQVVTYVLWTTVFMEVMTMADAISNERMLQDQQTAVKQNRFRMRKLSASGIHEAMIIQFDGDDYDITYIEEDYSEHRGHYIIVTAVRKTQNITKLVILDDRLAMGYSQTFSNQTATTLTVTAGTLPDPNTKDVDYFHQMVHLYRGAAGNMVRVVYQTGYTVSGQVITFTSKLRDENVLLHQYTTAST